jgi:hypothetical protein
MDLEIEKSAEPSSGPRFTGPVDRSGAKWPLSTQRETWPAQVTNDFLGEGKKLGRFSAKLAQSLRGGKTRWESAAGIVATIRTEIRRIQAGPYNRGISIGPRVKSAALSIGRST